MKVTRDKYGRYRKRGDVDRRPLHLKIRVELLRPMTALAARKLLEKAATTGIVPSGIVVHWVDWEKGESGRAKAGRITTGIRNALRDFYGAITSGETRFERVEE